MDRSRCWPLGRLFLLGALLAAAPGCGGGKADVKGVVTYNGTPVKSGTVAFAGADGSSMYAEIQPDGSYTASGVPVGSVKVAVSSPDPSTPPPAGGGGRGPTGPPKAAPKGDWRPLPPKYGTPDGSGLSVEVKSGSAPTVFDIKLTD